MRKRVLSVIATLAFFIFFIVAFSGVLSSFGCSKKTAIDRSSIEPLYSDYLYTLSEFTYGGILYCNDKMKWDIDTYQYLFGTDIHRLTNPELEAHMERSRIYQEELFEILPAFYARPETNLLFLCQKLEKNISDFNKAGDNGTIKNYFAFRPQIKTYSLNPPKKKHKFW